MSRSVRRQPGLEAGLALGAALLSATAVYADPEPEQPREQAQAPAAGPAPPTTRTPHQTLRAWKTEDRVRELTRTLGLSSEQQVQIRAILNRRLARAVQIRTADSVPAVERARQLQDLDRAVVEEIKQVLTPSQLRKYDPQGQSAPAGAADTPARTTGAG